MSDEQERLRIEGLRALARIVARHARVHSRVPADSTLQSPLAVEGELPEDGLAAFGDDGDDLMLALARKIVAGDEAAGSVESVFEQARQVAAEAEALLVDEGWHAPEPEPAIVEAGGVTVASEADGRREDADEPRRALFSWAEFMAGEPDEPPKPRRRDEAPTLSLFEWALEREQEGRSQARPVEGHGGIAGYGGVPGSRPCLGPFVVSVDSGASGRGFGNAATSQPARRPAPAHPRRGA